MEDDTGCARKLFQLAVHDMDVRRVHYFSIQEPLAWYRKCTQKERGFPALPAGSATLQEARAWLLQQLPSIDYVYYELLRLEWRFARGDEFTDLTLQCQIVERRILTGRDREVKLLNVEMHPDAQHRLPADRREQLQKLWDSLIPELQVAVSSTVH